VLQGEKLEKNYKVPTQMIDKTNYKTYMQSELYKVRYSL
jgi:ribose transport system substrate-binding protein